MKHSLPKKTIHGLAVTEEDCVSLSPQKEPHSPKPPPFPQSAFALLTLFCISRRKGREK